MLQLDKGINRSGFALVHGDCTPMTFERLLSNRLSACIRQQGRQISSSECQSLSVVALTSILSSLPHLRLLSFLAWSCHHLGSRMRQKGPSKDRLSLTLIKSIQSRPVLSLHLLTRYREGFLSFPRPEGEDH